jgi:hypothetical protein
VNALEGAAVLVGALVALGWVISIGMDVLNFVLDLIF